MPRDLRLRIATIVSEIAAGRRAHKTQEACARDPELQLLSGWMRGVMDATGMSHDKLLAEIEPLIGKLDVPIWYPS